MRVWVRDRYRKCLRRVAFRLSAHREMHVQPLVDFFLQCAAKKSHSKAELHVHDHPVVRNNQFSAQARLVDFERVTFPMGPHAVFSLQFCSDAIRGGSCSGKSKGMRPLNVDVGHRGREK